jgi:hypothetical protein
LVSPGLAVVLLFAIAVITVAAVRVGRRGDDR